MTVLIPPEDRRWYEWAGLLGGRALRLAVFLVTLPLGLYWGTRAARVWTAAIVPRAPARTASITVRCVAPTVIRPLSVQCRDRYHVQLAGIAVPRRSVWHTWAPDAALRRLIGEGSLELVIPTSPTRRDGAVRAYAFREAARGGAPLFLNAQLARAGVVALDTSQGITALDKRIARAARAARDDRRGIWAAAGRRP